MRLFLEAFNQLPRATRYFLYAMLAGYLLTLLVGPRMYMTLGLVPALVVERWCFWQLISYMFIHGGLLHLLLNAFMIWMFGTVLENIWGPRRFAWYCAITGIGAALFHIAAGPQSYLPVIGASGAVFGLLAAYALEFPETTVYVYFIFPMKARHMVLMMGLIELAASIKPGRSTIANLAHLGGLVTGYVYLRWWPRLLDKFSREQPPEDSVEQRPERRLAGSEIDRILDKISRYGVNSLSDNEQALMKRYSKWLKK